MALRILGIDPGLRRTGWGVISQDGTALHFIACGVIAPKETLSLAERLRILHDGLRDVILRHQPRQAAVEETFVNANAASALKLGQARGVALLTPALAGLEVAEYAANLVKKTITGTGHADKTQIGHMVGVLLPKAEISSEDAADALAIAICHAHHRLSVFGKVRLEISYPPPGRAKLDRPPPQGGRKRKRRTVPSPTKLRFT